LQSRVSKKEKE